MRFRDKGYHTSLLGGVMSGDGVFTKAGNGRMNLLGHNDFSGAVHVGGGVLGLGGERAGRG